MEEREIIGYVFKEKEAGVLELWFDPVYREKPVFKIGTVLDGMTHASLFSGIGGFDLAAQWSVFAITSRKFAEVFEHIHASLEAEGYEVQPFIIPASAVEAEHERNRVWIIAYSCSVGLSGQGGDNGRLQPAKIGNRQTSRFIDFVQRNSMPFLCSAHDGIPRKLAESTLHGAGNAIVPQIAYSIFETIKQFEYDLTRRV